MQVEQFLEHSAAIHPDKTALVCGSRRFSYRDLDQQSNRLARNLLAQGLERWDRVAVCLENSPETVISLFAILKAGGIFVLINPATKTEKLDFILDDCRATGLIALAGRWDPAALTGARPHLRWLWNAGPAAPGPWNPALRVVPLAEVLEGAAQSASPPPKRNIDVDLAALIYTSGTTGRPKGVMVTHRNMVAAATSTIAYLENSAADVILNVLPLSFSYGLYQVLTAFQTGATVVLEKSFAYPHAVLQTMSRERVTGFPLVPTIAATLLQLDLAAYSFPALRYLTNAAAALPTDHIHRLRGAFPGAKFFSMYGQTECKRISYLPPEQLDIRPDSVGRGMPNEEVYLVDEQGRRLPWGSTGELVVRGSHVMAGYWERPEESASALRPGRWPGESVLYTGDLFRTDSEGYLYFVSRKDDIIKTRGEKVSPKEVEDVLHALSGVVEAAVTGVPDPLLGQAIHAFVRLRAHANLTETDILRHCAAHLENFMVPKRISFVEELPKTGTGKLSRRLLASSAAETAQ